jgi:hypothetical protein
LVDTDARVETVPDILLVSVPTFSYHLLPKGKAMWDPFWTFGPGINLGSSRDAAQATSKANAAEQRVRELEHRVQRLALACNAMWSLLKVQTGLTDDQLREAVEQIDKAVMEAPAPQCAGCGRRLTRRQGKCMYCGAVNGNAPAF